MELGHGLNATTERLEWPVSFEQFQSWGGKASDKFSWTIEGRALCYFSINGKRVARGEK